MEILRRCAPRIDRAGASDRREVVRLGCVTEPIVNQSEVLAANALSMASVTPALAERRLPGFSGALHQPVGIAPAPWIGTIGAAERVVRPAPRRRVRVSA